MKLNYRRIVLVGMAFFLITAFWQAYDAIIPLILTNHFGLSQTVSGAVMSLDNVLAVFLLPIFGSISDRVDTKLGKRTPFIIVGTIVASISFFLLTFIDNFQLAKLLTAGNEVAGGDLAVLALEITEQNPLVFVGFMATLLVTLVAMATFRSPAVALMPDITPKPLRSKANAIINLMGSGRNTRTRFGNCIFNLKESVYGIYTLRYGSNYPYANRISYLRIMRQGKSVER